VVTFTARDSKYFDIVNRVFNIDFEKK